MEELENEVRSCLWGMSVEELKYLKERPYILDEVIYYRQQEEAEEKKREALASTTHPNVYNHQSGLDSENIPKR